MSAVLRLIDISDDATLEVSRHQRAADPVREWPEQFTAVREQLRLSLELRPMSEAPKEGTSFTAYLTTGKRVQAERYDEGFATPDNLLEASDFVGWLAGSEERIEAEVYALTERQQAAAYHAEEEDNERQYGLEDDRDALASAGFNEEE